MQINTNVIALQANANLHRVNRRINLSTERLSSGLKINSVADNPSGLAISNKLRSQLRGLNIASQNSLEGVSVMQTAEGALEEINVMIQRMRELAVQAANETNNPDDRQKMQIEVDQLVTEIDDMVKRTEYNSKALLSGDFSRLTQSRWGSVKADNIFKTLFISTDIPEGSLNYQIDQMGIPAKIEGSISSSYAFSDAEFTINGEKVSISSTDTPEEVIAKLQEACVRSDIEVKTPDYPNAGPLIFVSKNTGQNASISIEPPSSAILAELGLTAGTVKGKDPIISNISFTDSKGNPSSIFGSASAVNCDGNRVEIIGANGKKIVLDLKMDVLDDGTYQLKNGTVINNDGTIASGAIIGLSMEITDIGPLIIQAGAEKNMEMHLNIPKISAETLGLDKLNYKTVTGSSDAIGKCDAALSMILEVRATLGTFQNRLEHTINSLNTSAVNVEKSRSRIMDTDMAEEMTNYTQMSILSQAGISILAQANQRPQQLLQLLN